MCMCLAARRALHKNLNNEIDAITKSRLKTATTPNHLRTR